MDFELKFSQTKQDAVGDYRLEPWCHHLANWTKRKRRLWFWPIRSIIWKDDVIHKPEVH